MIFLTSEDARMVAEAIEKLEVVLMFLVNNAGITNDKLMLKIVKKILNVLENQPD